MLLLHNQVRDYAWGAPDGMAALVGSTPSGGHEAELWIGTHPAAPSLVAGDAQGRTLAEVIAAEPARWLGEDLAAAGHTALPFLLKVLAVGSPLSLQAHPTAAQAEAGFDREEAAGVPIDAPQRTYRDRGAKPEMLVAIEESWGLCGFRPRTEAATLVESLGVPTLEPLVHVLRSEGDRAHRIALGWLLHLQSTGRDSVATGVAGAVSSIDPDDLDDPRAWVHRIAAAFPDDPLALAPLLLEVVHLAPGDALHLPAGYLHAYLRGAGVELMAASDNVLRGGLTPKHIDVDELLAVLRPEPGHPEPPVRKDLAGGVAVFDVDEAAFGLAVVDPTGTPVDIHPTAPSLLLATQGPVDVAGPHEGIEIRDGDAAFVAPGEGPITVSGTGHLWWATTGDGLPG